MCFYVSLVMSLLTRRHYNTSNGSRLTGLTCSNAPGFWMVEHQLVSFVVVHFIFCGGPNVGLHFIFCAGSNITVHLLLCGGPNIGFYLRSAFHHFNTDGLKKINFHCIQLLRLKFFSMRIFMTQKI